MPYNWGLLYAPFGANVYYVVFFRRFGLGGGLYLCRAFNFWASPAQTKTYSLIVLFLPRSDLTSAFGKDSWIASGLGLTALAILRFSDRYSNGIWHLIAGGLNTTVIPPYRSSHMIQWLRHISGV